MMNKSGSSKLYEQVVEKIEMMISQGEYKKGDLIPSEKELMNMTGVSRITVRGALKILSEAGVIETQKGRGSIVLISSEELIKSTIGQEEYIRNFENSTKARIMIEPEVAKQVALTATDEEIEKLGKTLDSCESSDFHKNLVSLVHNPFIENIFSQLMENEVDRALANIIPPGKQKAILPELKHQHEKIFEAIRDRKPDYAYFYTKEHQEFIYDIYHEHFKIFYE